MLAHCNYAAPTREVQPVDVSESLQGDRILAGDNQWTVRVQRTHRRRLLAFLCSGVLVGLVDAAHLPVSQKLEPISIHLGDAAQLTLAAVGDSRIVPPTVTGLDFILVGKSQRLQSVNGKTQASTTVVYRVVPRKAGVYNIPSSVPGLPADVLTVARTAATSAASNVFANVGNGRDGMQQTAADGTAFVRLLVRKHSLYVGETIPVDIQVGTREGRVDSMNGPPTPNGEAFLLDELTSEPERSTEIVGGEPFTIFTWHSALAAVKPGTFSLTLDTPLTVHVPAPARVMRRFFDSPDEFFDEDMQGAIDGSTEKDITVSSNPDSFTILALPELNRPAGFNGAVGQFAVTSELIDDKAEVGVPLTLRFKVAGTGNFDRVKTSMLHSSDHWKTYEPTAKFTPTDKSNLSGEKAFEQRLIATTPGTQTVPPLAFSWFDPATGRFETAQTAPLTSVIAPVSKDQLVTSTNLSPAPPSVGLKSPLDEFAVDGMRLNHMDSNRGSTTLQPSYIQPAYIAVSTMVVIMSGALFWLRRQKRVPGNGGKLSLEVEPLIKVMDEASSAGDAVTFFKAARLTLQRSLAPQWNLDPESITAHDVDAHFDVDSAVARIFRLADETAYAGNLPEPMDFQRWKHLVLLQVRGELLQ
jgi:hypothetical protein